MNHHANMTTPWNRIGQEFKQWLQNAGATAEEFNELGLVERRTLLTQFEQQQEQQQQQQATEVSFFRALVDTTLPVLFLPSSFQQTAAEAAAKPQQHDCGI
jgi:hypothetical protein